MAFVTEKDEFGARRRALQDQAAANVAAGLGTMAREQQAGEREARARALAEEQAEQQALQQRQSFATQLAAEGIAPEEAGVDVGERATGLGLLAERKREERAATQEQKRIDRETRQAERKANIELKKTQKALKQKELDNFEKKIAAKKKTEKPKESQFKAATFSNRIEQAELDFGALEGVGYNRADKTSAAETFLPEALKSDEAKRQEQAERNFVTAVLRRESGAAISDQEFDTAEKQYFPRVGDTPNVLEQKRRNRAIVLENMKREAGAAFQPLSQTLAAAGVAPTPQVVSQPAQLQPQQVEQARSRLDELRAKAAQGAPAQPRFR